MTNDSNADDLMVVDVMSDDAYNYPHSTLTGTPSDNPTLQTQFNNVEYSDYTRFLWGWLDFYASTDRQSGNMSRQIEAYSNEIMLWAMNA